MADVQGLIGSRALLRVTVHRVQTRSFTFTGKVFIWTRVSDFVQNFHRHFHTWGKLEGPKGESLVLQCDSGSRCLSRIARSHATALAPW